MRRVYDTNWFHEIFELFHVLKLIYLMGNLAGFHVHLSYDSMKIARGLQKLIPLHTMRLYQLPTLLQPYSDRSNIWDDVDQ